ncbi:hypothetical protein [Endozoicomonas atrinae]|uniref:hypothetical protein n=1 Tax=Endozoicomonas atrinae TaxID=1333660 RepID=UPI0008244465|nr:hypothetical protein [Endozoicomonas atrinae]
MDSNDQKIIQATLISIQQQLDKIRKEQTVIREEQAAYREEQRRQEDNSRRVERELILLSSKFETMHDLLIDMPSMIQQKESTYGDYTMDDLGHALRFTEAEFKLVNLILADTTIDELMNIFELQRNVMQARVYRLTKKMKCKSQEHLKYKIEKMIRNEEVFQQAMNKYLRAQEVNHETEVPETG